MVNTVSLLELTKIQDDENLSKKYVCYLCGFDESHRYRHDEILAIKKLTNVLNLSEEECTGFLYGYSIPQLNKEFDLLKICEACCVNIEIKTDSPGIERIKKQLISNRHYLKMLNKSLFLYTFVSNTSTLYKLNDDDSIERVNTYHELISFLLQESTNIDLDELFRPSNILVSPLNSPDKFLSGNYLLTENQQTIKNKIINSIKGDKLFLGLHGLPGTGKTLLLYDIGFELSKEYKVLILHCGIMCDGQIKLNSHSSNLTISEVKVLKLREIKGYDIVLVDEAHRMYPSQLEKVYRWVPKANAKCVFSFDESQRLSQFENKINNIRDIKQLCGEDGLFKLTNKIRTNKGISNFITCLRDLSKYNETIHFGDIALVYEEDDTKAIQLAKDSETEGFTYISYTPSTIYSRLNYQKTSRNTHKVIGQEYDGVVMIINHDFFYHDNILSSNVHPNPDYIYTQLLYQGLTRARTKIKLIIQEKDVLSKLLDLLSKGCNGF